MHLSQANPQRCSLVITAALRSYSPSQHITPDPTFVHLHVEHVFHFGAHVPVSDSIGIGISLPCGDTLAGAARGGEIYLQFVYRLLCGARCGHLPPLYA